MQAHERRATSNSPAAERLWQRFGEMFGARFFDAFGPKPSESWRDAVDDLRADQIRGALTRIRNSGSPHPPSLPEFVSLAKNISVQQQQAEPERVVDGTTAWANRCLLVFLVKHGPFDEAVLQRLVAVKNRIAAQRTDGGISDEEGPEWRDAILAAFTKTAGVAA